MLVEHCQSCHGPKKQNGGLRLDRHNGAIEGGDSGPAIIPRKPDDSLLVKAIRRHPDVSAMPPSKAIPPAAVTAIEEWVRRGAVWPETKATGVALGDVAAINDAAKKHWAFQPIRSAPAPAVRQLDWPATSIDQYLLSAMEARGLHPAADADRATLLRRVYFDLVGLPPSPQDCDSFLGDPDPTPLAFSKVVDRLLASPHYGERWGRHWLDVARYADTKGYVFQEERRYPFSYTYRDWVVAALNDDLPYDQFVRAQIAADKMQRTDNRHLAAMGFLTVGRRFLQDVHEINDDRIDVVTRGLLGLTVSCARCHDHKYDPVSMADYYGLYGVFASSEEPKDLPILASVANAAQRSDFDAKMRERTSSLNKYLEEQHGLVERRLLEDAEKLLRLHLTLGPKAGPQQVADAAKQQGLSVGAVRRWFERWNQTVLAASKRGDAAVVAWAQLAAIPQQEFAAKAPRTLDALRVEMSKPPGPVFAAFLAKPLSARESLPSAFASYLRDAAKSPRAAADYPSLFGAAGAFRVPPGEAQQFFDRKQRERAKALERSIEELKVMHPGAEARAMVMVDRPKPVEPRIFLRGNPGRPGPPTSRAFLTVLSGGRRKQFKEGSGRGELAEAIIRPDNPLTPRVLVNRVWQWRFGKGMAASPSDFGLRSEPPSHPELLDHLAGRFWSDGWSLKELHRWMLQSRAYQLSGTVTATEVEKDPDNRYLARFPRLRLDWESLRDAVLAASGGLDERLGGRGTPLFTQPYSKRRTLYGFIDRQNLDPAYRTFDFATPDATSPQRYVTIVPQQGLFLLNSQFILDEAERMSLRADLAASGDPRRRVELLFRYAHSKVPQTGEVDPALAYLRRQPDWASKSGAAWSRLAQALLMSNEFGFVD